MVFCYFGLGGEPFYQFTYTNSTPGQGRTHMRGENPGKNNLKIKRHDTKNLNIRQGGYKTFGPYVPYMLFKIG